MNWKISILTFISIFSAGIALGDVDISGYYRNQFSVVSTSGKLRTQDLHKSRLKFSASPSEKTNFELALNLFAKDFPKQEDLQLESLLAPRLDVDRAYLKLYFSKFDLTLGKQRIAWGNGLLWNPTDVYNEIDPFDPKGEREGVSALHAYIPLSDTASIATVLAFGDTVNDARTSLKASAVPFGVDFALSLTKDGTKQWIYGLDLKGELKVGYWLEGAYFRTTDDNFYKVECGLDYTFGFGNGIYVALEFFHDSSGFEKLDKDAFTKLLTRERDNLSRNYLYMIWQYQINDFASFRPASILNADDRSFILLPTFSYLLFTDVEIIVGANIFGGKEGGEYNPNNKQDPAGIFGNSAFFVWLQMNF
ncbi:MAG: hypothetical protein H8D67_13555 [Deltaproteobacteria bacterium]|nr:hypothetical protein [Deltaproteobacteria bacterium]